MFKEIAVGTSCTGQVADVETLTAETVTLNAGVGAFVAIITIGTCLVARIREEEVNQAGGVAAFPTISC